MVDVNRMTTPANTRWKLVDRTDGAENTAIEWRLRVGDRVKVRLVNEMDSTTRCTTPSTSTARGGSSCSPGTASRSRTSCGRTRSWLPTGETVDIALDVTNPGRWMAHCHIAEHHEGGMMFSFDVDPAPEPAR